VDGGERVRGGIKVYPPSKIFAKLVNKNAKKHTKCVPSPQIFSQPTFQLKARIQSDENG
jgi:hypothetical protein